MALKIATLNINGLRDANKRMSFIQWLHFVDWDVLCLQECYVTSSGTIPLFHLVSIVPGVGHLFKNSISLKNHSVDSEGRLVLGEFAIRELSFLVCCVYANQVRARNEVFEFCCDFIDPGIRVRGLQHGDRPVH